MNIECQDNFVRIANKIYPCTVSVTMDLIGGKWKAVILYHLKDDKKRYNELRKEMPGITERTLSLQLKQLEEDGLISRKVYGDKPPVKVIYSLTDFGKSCTPLLNAIVSWGNEIALKKGKFIASDAVFK